MIGLLPDRNGYSDELFYSLCARYGDIMGYPPFAVFRDLFRSEKVIVSTLLARKLEVFIGQLPPGHELTVDSIIDDYTLLPYFAPFLSLERINRLRENMVKGGNYTKPIDAGIYSGRIKLPDTLRFCPFCVTEERKQLGACYWHRLHQIPGVMVCPVHQTWLEPGQIPVNLSLNLRYISAEQAVAKAPARFLDPASFSHRVLLDIANEFSWLGQQHGLSLDLRAMRQRYFVVLIERGFASYRGDLFASKLLTAFKQAYPENLLRLLHCEIDEAIETPWLLRLLRTFHQLCHPLYHLMFIHFLGYKLAEFINLPTTYQPFGSGPWPCLNLVCSKYLEPSIEQVVIRYVYDKTIGTKPRGSFACGECGFTYSRNGPDQSAEDQFRRNPQVEIYGWLWDERLISLWPHKSITVEHMATKLGVGITTVREQATRLSLDMTTSGQRFRHEDGGTGSPLKPTATNMAAKIAAYQAEWLAALEQDADLGATALHHKYGRVYAWLHRNQREWLLQHRPPRLKEKKPFPPRVDWASRDLEFAQQVRAAGLQLRNQVNPFRKVTRRAIGLIRPQTRQLGSQLDKLPLTAAALDQIVEDEDTFSLRRVWQTALMFCQTGVLPSRAGLYKKAGVNNMLKRPLIADALNEALGLLAQTPSDCTAIQARLASLGAQVEHKDDRVSEAP